jgi:hypothetical protein
MPPQTYLVPRPLVVEGLLLRELVRQQVPSAAVAQKAEDSV